MPQLDKLIEKIQAKQEIVLESGKAPVLKSEAGTTAILNQLLSAAQVTGLVQEIAPADGREALAQRKALKFEYKAGARTVQVDFSAEGEQVIARISMNGENGKGAAAAQPQAQAKAADPEPEVNALLRKMFKMGASDLHLTSSHRPLVRVNGDMKELGDEPVLKNERMEALLSAILPPHNALQFKEIHDTDFAHEITGLARFRVNVFMDRFGMGAVFRQIPMDIVTAENLGLSKEIIDLCFLSKGLVLVTGPTGSGKSTTLCALVDYINRHRRDHIITIEDPIEFVHNRKNCLINQREVHVHTKSFSQALRAALREDPDIVLVGEMRDLETISIAIETAETGHLVFGTLHTTTAASTVDRIIDQFPADRQSQIRTMLSTSLKAVISQTLCKKIGGGRVAAMEALFVNSAVANLIREGKIFQIPSVMQTGKKQGMTTLNDVLFKLVVDKAVAPEEAYIKAVDKPAFVALLKTKGIVLNMTEIEE
ncbi:MAG TPA: type IV pili twitching motility protein PilT [Elusimicrobia bacterium]|nr:type IV pili twitching motility protein PilT [Elusimicrobiota bacterium]